MGNAESAFLAKEFTNWKDATAIFAKHETSVSHKDAYAALADKHNIGDLLSEAFRRRGVSKGEESHISIERTIPKSN